MAFGILVGTYSSIYVALPVILLWGVKRDDEEARAIGLAAGPALTRGGLPVRQPPAIDGFGAGGFRVAGVWRQGLAADPGRHAASLATDLVGGCHGRGLRGGDRSGPARRRRSSSCWAPARPRRCRSRAIRDALRAAGLGLEFMATEAAARTYNVLASEGRLVRHRSDRRLVGPAPPPRLCGGGRIALCFLKAGGVAIRG